MKRRNILVVEKSPHVVSEAPIDQWLELLENTTVEKLRFPIHRSLSRTLLYISKYEDLPSPEESGGINFR